MSPSLIPGSLIRGHARVLFLDVDGVLNRCGKSNQGMESAQVAQLERIIAACDPQIVVSSTWRISERSLTRLVAVLYDIGGRFGGITPYHNDRTDGGIYIAKARGNEIQEWMDTHGHPDRFVILDDDSDMCHLKEHLIKTESFVGLTPEIADKVIARFKEP